MGTEAKFRDPREKRWCFASIKCSVSTFVLEIEATNVLFTQGVTLEPPTLFMSFNVSASFLELLILLVLVGHLHRPQFSISEYS